MNMAGFQFGRDVCEALGLGKRSIRALNLRIRFDSIPTVTLQEFIDGDNGEKLVEVFKRYEIDLLETK